MTTQMHFTRRNFLKYSAAFGAISILPSHVALGNKSKTDRAPSEKLNLAVIGIGNRPNNVRSAMIGSGLCNVVALCDIDLQGKHTHEARYVHRLTDRPPSVKKGKRPPKQARHKAKAYTDFRLMFDEMGDSIDAVLIGTPDHSHYAATMLAMSLGKHVYVEKPLAHTFGQSQRLMDLAERSGVATQVGNQGFSGGNYFQFKAWREAGLIRDISKITASMNLGRRWHGWGKNAKAYPQDSMPEGIDWAQWQDIVATSRPFSNRLHPLEWRSWFEFGSGAFGDWGPHILDSCHHFLELGLPESVSALHRKGTNELVYPQESTIQFKFPQRAPDLPECEVTWYDGRKNRASFDPEYEEKLRDPKTGKLPELKSPGKILYSKDLIFQGGHHGSELEIITEKKSLQMRSKLPEFPKKNSNHYENFLLACKGEEQTRSPFRIGGLLNQVFSLGIIAQRLGGDLKFDHKTKQITNNKAAQALLDPAPRKGWEQFNTL